MTGRVIIVTGASSGLGYEVARYLCEGGNDVILACRNEEKTKAAIEKIKRQNPNALATFMQLDLADMESVKKFVEDFHATEKKLHALVNNAGMTLNFKDTKRQYTKDNLEITMGTNHFGPFLLTNLLLEDLKKVGGEENGDARIVNVTSMVHDPDSMRRKTRQIRDLKPLDMDNLLLYEKDSYNGIQAYKNSKLANIMFTYELAKKLEGTGVTVNCVCPGFIPSTDLSRNAGKAQKFFLRYILHGMLRFTKITRSIQQGSQAICNLVTDEKLKGVTGKYYKDGAEAKSSEESQNEDNQKKLWEISAGYCKLEGYEPLDIPEPPPEEEEKPKEEEKKEGETSKEGENKEGDEKADETKKEEKEGEEKKEETKEGEKEEKEEKKEEEEDLKKEKIEDVSKDADEKATEEKAEQKAE